MSTAVGHEMVFGSREDGGVGHQNSKMKEIKTCLCIKSKVHYEYEESLNYEPLQIINKVYAGKAALLTSDKVTEPLQHG